tara:strand:- start:3273 stop:3509 length:237 start_codon:yes stop_codon:yes gene_type:complete
MFEWDQRKSIELKKRHGFSFENVVLALEKEFLIIDSPNKARSQKAFLTFVGDYPVVVPFEFRKGKYRLITAWPDRRYK